MNDTSKGLLISTLGVLLVIPDSLFVRLINAGALTIAFWRLLLSGGLLCMVIAAMQGSAPFRAVLRMARYGALYMFGAGVSGVLSIAAVSLTSVANVVFIIASLPIFAAVFSRIFLSERFTLRVC